MLVISDLEDIFGGRVGPGLHRISEPVAAEDLAERAAGHGWVALVVALTDVADKATVLQRFAEAGRFPGYTARNWDALQDALGDLSWLAPAGGFLVVLAGWDHFAAADPDDATVAAAVVTQAGTEWAAAGTPLVALVV